MVEASISHIQGFKVAGVSCGLKNNGALDFALVVSDRPCVVAGVFTTNLVKAAPVLVDMDKLANNPEGMRAVAVNTRCANACTGRKGIQDAHVMARWTAEAIGTREEDVLVMSTGVIGTHLPMDKIHNGVTLSSRQLGDHWDDAANAIMTTDTKPKSAMTTARTTDGRTYSIGGISKGSGMIAPNMATMLAVICTDAALPQARAQQLLSRVADVSYNQIVVDGDMSTNDTLMMLANGASGVTLTDADLPAFEVALRDVCQKLAHDIVRDGEGVTKFITLDITGAPDRDAARKIANTIATSPLVKTAFYGGDANWGRIVAAAGRAGVPLHPDNVQLWIAPGENVALDAYTFQLFDRGIAAEYNESDALEIMKEPSISVRLDCGAGDGAATVWTCDLSHDYVSINGHYRT